MREILGIFLTGAVPFICGAVISALIAYVKTSRKKVSALEDGVQSLLRAEIIRSHEKYSEKGFCPIYAKEALKRAYNAYHALGGNDVATHLYTAMMDLPSCESERKENR